MAPNLPAPSSIEMSHSEEVLAPDIKQKYLFLKDSTDLSSFVWPADERPTTLDEGRDLPIVDLAELYSGSECRRREIVQAIAKAFEEWGFFKLVNHPISVELIDKVQEHSRKFFNLPLEQKTKAAWKDDLFLGGYGSVGRLLKTGKLWSESLLFRWLEEECRDVSGFISQALPDNYQEFSATIEEYLHELEKLSIDLLELIAESLNLNKDVLVDKWKSASNALLTVHSYPPCPQAELTLGLAAHADRGLITILNQDDVGGLQVRKDGEWTTVKPQPGSLIVNVGDVLQAISNGRYLSAIHRVATNVDKGRISMAFFASLKFGDSVISVAPELVDAEHPIKYKPFTMKEFTLAARNPTIQNDNILGVFAV